MKICSIISAYSPYTFGGADIFAEKISREIVKRGNPAVIITINPNRGDSCEKEDGTKIYRFHPFNFSTMHKIGQQSILRQGAWTLLDIYNYYSYYKVKHILKDEKPDIVHLHTSVDFTLSAFDAVKSLGLPLVYTLHDYLLLCRRIVLLHANGVICTEKNINPFCRLYREFSQNIVNRSVDLVISPSEFTLKLYKENGFFINTEKMILPNGIDLDLYQSASTDEAKSRNKSTIDILYTGSLTRHKGIHVLIKAVRAIPNLNLRLHIVGNGVYEKELRRMAGDDNRIIFHGKFANKDMRQFYCNSNVLVVPSIWYDVRPGVISEAYRDGVPVIGADIGGIPELIRENQTGFLFKSGDAGDLKRVLEMVIKNPMELKKIGKNASAFIKQFEMSGYLDRLIKVYKRVIEINNSMKLLNFKNAVKYPQI